MNFKLKKEKEKEGVIVLYQWETRKKRSLNEIWSHICIGLKISISISLYI